MEESDAQPQRPPALRRNVLLVSLVAVAVVALSIMLVRQQALNQPASQTDVSAGQPAQPIPTAAPPSPPVPPPPAPAAPAAPPGTPSFDVVRVNPRGDAVIAGRTAANADVTVLDGGKPLGHVRADDDGQFVFLPDTPLPTGGQQLTLSARAPDGRQLTSDKSVLLVVPDRAGPGQPANPPLAVLTQPEAPSQVLQAPPAVAPSAGQAPTDEHLLPKSGAPAHLALDVVDYDEHGGIRFSGTAPAGTTVRLYIDNHLAGSIAADLTGRWTLTPEGTVTTGTHRLRADQLAANGRVASRVELPFQRVNIDPATLAEGRVLVQPGQNLWRLARRVYGSGLRYTVIYQANRDQIRDPHVIYPGQAFAIPAVPASGAPSGSTTPASSSKSR